MLPFIVAQMSTKDYAIAIPESSFKRLKEISDEYRLSMDELVQLAVVQWLEEHAHSKTSESQAVNPSVPVKYSILHDDKPKCGQVNPEAKPPPRATAFPESGKKGKNA